MAEQNDNLQKFKRMLDGARGSLAEPRELSQRDRDYYDGKQLTLKQRGVLKRRKQPETIRNRIGPAIDGILGILEQAKVDPRAFPRTPQDEDSADIATKSLQYIADKNRFHKTKLEVADNHLVEGIGAVIVEADESGEIYINQIRFEEFFYDPHSREADYRDAKFMGVAKWMYAEDVARSYPEYAAEISASVSRSSSSPMGDLNWDDKPDSQLPWIDKNMRRLLVVDMYYNEGGWKRAVFCAAGVLEEGDSLYLDSDGYPSNPIEATSCFVDRDLNRYGLVRRMVSLQDELNARASRSLHLLNSRQLQVANPDYPPEVSADTARTEAARADGVLPVGYTVVPTVDMAQGNLNIMSEVAASLDRLAPTPAVLGRSEGSSQSGRSRLVLQQAGMTEIARPLGRLEDWENRVYRQAWERAKQFWTDEMWIRVTDDEGAPEFLQINTPIYQRMPLLDPVTGAPVMDPETGEPMTQVVMQPQPVMGPDGQPQVDPNTGQPVMQPQPVLIGFDNRIADMDMDIVVDTVPDTANLAAEQFATLSQLAQAYGPEAVPFEDLVELSSLPDKRKWRERREARMKEQQNPQVMQMQMQAAQLDMEEKEAKVQETQTKAQLNLANATKAEADVVKQAADMRQQAINAAGLGSPLVIE